MHKSARRHFRRGPRQRLNALVGRYHGSADEPAAFQGRIVDLSWWLVIKKCGLKRIVADITSDKERHNPAVVFSGHDDFRNFTGIAEFLTHSSGRCWRPS